MSHILFRVIVVFLLSLMIVYIKADVKASISVYFS
jgi:hypothetical protein